MLAPGTLLQNRYLIMRLIAEGGMGAVYLARDQRLDSPVALKVTRFTDQRMSKAFEREARLLARLRHPALPRVSDHFIEENGQFLIMEYIPGEDLAETLKRRAAPFSYDDVIRWADQLLDALEYLHSQEPPIVHRDIKPQNLKLTERGQIILLDFGLAKGIPLHMTRVTSSGSIYGYTPSYAPMEQIQGAGTDPRSDLYSLGATLYHFVTGATPIDALTRAAAIVEGQSDPLSIGNNINGHVRPAVAAVVLKAMALSRNQRHASAAEMRQAMSAASSLVGAANEETAVIGALRRPVTPLTQEQQQPVPVVLHPESEESGSEATMLQEEAAWQEDVQSLLSSGAAAFDGGEYAVAIGDWEAALKLSPNEPGVKESIDGARRLIRKEEGRKARVERLVAEGTAAFDAKRYEAASETWSEALTLSPDEPGVEASVKTARVAAERQGQREAKIKHLVLGGTEAFDVKDYELAIQRWTEVLTLSPDEPGIKKSIEAASQKRRELQEAPKEEKRSYEDETAAKPASHFARDVRRSPARTHWPTLLAAASPRTPAIIGAGIVVFILLVVLVLFKQFNQGGSQRESRSTSVAQLPQPQGMLNDFASKLSSANKQQIETLLENFRDRTGIEVAVVTVSFDDLQGYPIEEYALQLGRQWGVGRDSEKRALVLLVAINPPDSQGLYHGGTRLEVSRHLEGDVPDILAGELIRKMRNDFTAGRFDQALTTGTQTILATLAQSLGISLDGIDSSQAASSTPSSAIAPAQSGTSSSHAEKPLISLPPGQPLIVTVDAATGESWVKYQVDDSKPTTLVLKQGQSQDLPPAEKQVTLNCGNRLTLKLKINNQDADFPPDTPQFKSKVVISRDNLQKFLR